MDKLLELKKMIEEASIEAEFKTKALQIVDVAIARGSITDEEKNQLVEMMQLGEEIAEFLENEHLKAADALGSYVAAVDKAGSDAQKDLDDAGAESEEELAKIVPDQQN